MNTVPGSLLLSMLFMLVVSGTGLAQWNGEIVGWGRNEDGQCDVPEPNEGFVAVAGGLYHSLSRDTQFPAVGGHPHSRTRGSVPCLHGVHFLNYSLDSMA